MTSEEQALFDQMIIEAVNKELLEALEEMLIPFSPYAAAFRDGKGIETCARAESALAKAKETGERK